LLHRATEMAAVTDSFEEALRHCIQMVCEFAGWPIGHVYLADESAGDLFPSDIWHSGGSTEHLDFRKATMQTRFAPGVGLPGRILTSGRPAWIQDVHNDDNFLRTRYDIPIAVRAAFGFPLKFEGKTVAVLEFFSRNSRPPDEGLLQLVQSLGEQVGRVLERRNAERKIHQSEERFRRLAENIEEIHWMRDPETADIPVIVLTAHAFPEDRKRASEVGCDVFLTKPCEPRDVMNEVRRLIGG